MQYSLIPLRITEWASPLDQFEVLRSFSSQLLTISFFDHMIASLNGSGLVLKALVSTSAVVQHLRIDDLQETDLQNVKRLHFLTNLLGVCESQVRLLSTFEKVGFFC